MNRHGPQGDYYSEANASQIVEGRPIHRTSQGIVDELLVLRCRRQDLAAWDELVARWNDRLLYYLRRLLNDENDSINALQETWLQAFRGIHSLRDDSRVAPWLYTIARRTALNHFRQHYTRRETESPDATGTEWSDERDDQLTFENAELVHFGLGRLALAEREILTLYFLDDLTVAEISAMLQVPQGTVKSRLFAARASLRRVLERETKRHDR